MIIAVDVRPSLGDKTGIGNYIYNLVRNLAKIDSKNDYILYSNKPFDFPINNKRFHKKIFRYPLCLWHFRVFIDILSRRVDIYHTSSMIIPAMYKGKCFIFLPDMTTFLLPQYHIIKSRFVNIFYRRAIRNAKAIFTISYNSKKDILKIFSKEKNPDLIKVIYLAASGCFCKINDINYLGNIRNKYNLPENFILFVGTAEPRKNLIGLINAFSKIKMKINHKLVIVGGRGWLNSEMYEVIKKKGLEEDVIFTGYVPETDLAAIYNLAELFVYPSFYEGFGIPVLEAMACGVPVVTSNTSSLPEVTGGSALLCDPYGNTDVWASAISSILIDKALRNQMILKGLEQAKKFSWEKTAKETLDIFEKCEQPYS